MEGPAMSRKTLSALAAVAVIGAALTAAGANYLAPSVSQQVNAPSRGLAVPGTDAIGWPNPFRLPQSVAAEWPVKVAKARAGVAASLAVPSRDSYAWPDTFRMPVSAQVEWPVGRIVTR
jgi:hypothetical protein